MLGISFCSFKQVSVSGGQKDFSASNTRASWAETLLTVSNGANDSFVTDWLQSKMAFFQFLGIAARRPA